MENYKGLLIAGIILVMGVAAAIFIVIAALGIFSREPFGASSLPEPVSAAEASHMDDLNLVFCLDELENVEQGEQTNEDGTVLSPQCVEVNRKAADKGLEILEKLKTQIEIYKNSKDKTKALELIPKLSAELNAIKTAGGAYKKVREHVDKHQEILEEFKAVLAKLVAQGKRIFLHWTAGGYDQVSNNYTYNIKKNGEVVFTGGNAHTYARNTGNIGIVVTAMAGGNTNCYKNLRGTDCPTPITEAQLNAMVELAARLAQENNIPVDVFHIMTHGEAASLKDYAEGGKRALVDQVTQKCKHLNAIEGTACAQELGLPHDNYGPYYGGRFERWEFLGHEDELRDLIRTKVGSS